MFKSNLKYVILGIGLLVVIIAFFFSGSKPSFDESYYYKVLKKTIPYSEVIESKDNGEWVTSTLFRCDSLRLKKFILDNRFEKVTGYQIPLLVPILSEVNNPQMNKGAFMYAKGGGGGIGKNNWWYLADTSKSLLWVQIQYPDWAGN